MNSSPLKMILTWVSGCALLGLRLAENLIGFDAGTGLTTPTFARSALIAALVLAVLIILFLCRPLPTDRPLFADHFSAPGKSTVFLVLGGFLLMGGGALLGARTLLSRAGIAPLVTAALAIAAGCGFLVLTKRARHGEADNVTPLLPALFFSAFWVLSLYLPASSDPVLARYWLPILAAAMAAYALSLLAGFFRSETRVRTFAAVAHTAVILCIAAAADVNTNSSLLFLGCAVILSAFLSLRRI